MLPRRIEREFSARPSGNHRVYYISDKFGDNMVVDSDLDADPNYFSIKIVLLMKKKSKQPIDKSKIFSGKIIYNFRIWPK
jgi:hypothetical protein